MWIYEVWSNRVRIPPKLIKTEYRKWPDRLPLSNKRLLSNKLPLYYVIALLSLYKTPLFQLIKASSLVDAPDNKTYQWMDGIERFSLDCHKTKTKVNTLANQRT